MGGVGGLEALFEGADLGEVLVVADGGLGAGADLSAGVVGLKGEVVVGGSRAGAGGAAGLASGGGFGGGARDVAGGSASGGARASGGASGGLCRATRFAHA